ncbi:MAG TPA: SAM-dependent methyltransferase, partial [Streptosporangiaceae bacterium]|nr:SAM-dependent methyltransferase [Streptosporangiaceae bacterium]
KGAEVIAALLARVGLDLPVRLRAWDGSEAGSLGGPVLVARSPRALQRILWRPGELGLARAYVSGDLDVEGDLTEGLRRVHAAPRGTRAAIPLAALSGAPSQCWPPSG